MSASRVSTLKNSSLQFIGLCMVRTGSARPRPGRPDYIQYLVKLPKINHSSNVENINNLLVSKQAVQEALMTVHGPWIVRRDPNEPESAILSVNSGILDLSGIRFTGV